MRGINVSETENLVYIRKADQRPLARTAQAATLFPVQFNGSAGAGLMYRFAFLDLRGDPLDKHALARRLSLDFWQSTMNAVLE
jgi:hypothetical protein